MCPASLLGSWNVNIRTCLHVSMTRFSDIYEILRMDIEFPANFDTPAPFVRERWVPEQVVYMIINGNHYFMNCVLATR